MKENGSYDRSIVIVHSDHGSMITRNRPSFGDVEKITKEDYRASYSTLFAVKYPGSEYSIDRRTLSLSYLLEEFMASLPAFTNPGERYTLFRPSDTAPAEKIDPYVYLNGTYPKNRIDIDIFKD
jgi:arylsulfatase A-like enzyme